MWWQRAENHRTSADPKQQQVARVSGLLGPCQTQLFLWDSAAPRRTWSPSSSAAYLFLIDSEWKSTVHCNHIKPAPRSYICCLKALPIKGVLNSLSFSQAPYNAPASRVQHITVSVPSPWKRKGNKVSVTN